MKYLASGIAFAALACAPAMAQNTSWYGDIGYTVHSIDGDDAGFGDVDLGAITAHGGLEFSPNFAVEGEASFGVQDEDFSAGATTGSVNLNYLIGAYGRAQYPVTPALTVFARAGLVQAELEAEISGGAGTVTESQSETGAGYGVGAEFMLDEQNGVRLDYTRYDIEDLESDAITIAYRRKF